ncbi:MarR family winged helix-turn-helix transcriptional regulator [Streptomyces sp. NPDC059215]|uniref:MarR family winged helix-turn-helix transcriptional regulator n=1 Tax=Streptomyces sp. NPDC059215 TaxID=3346772 RepID=UPI0036B0CCC3
MVSEERRENRMSLMSIDRSHLCNNLAIRKAARYLGASYDKALLPVGLRATQFSILQRLGVQGEMTITNLAEVIAMDRTTMASNLKPLAREGLVAVKPSEADRRVRIAGITPGGLDRLMLALPLWQAVQDQFEDRFGSDQAARLRASLADVLDSGFQPWVE